MMNYKISESLKSKNVMYIKTYVHSLYYTAEFLYFPSMYHL
jgi:hypothetical protein